MKVVYGIDVGGTFIKVGKFSNNLLIEKYSFDTIISNNHMDIINQIKDIIIETIHDDNLIGIGVAIPGPVKNGNVLGAQNIKWKTVPLKSILESYFPNVKISIVNDANAAALGEWYYGAGKKAPNMVMITLGTGVGGGIVINGKIIEGVNGSAGELGHIKIYPYSGRKCTCGLVGCLETYTSAVGIVDTALEEKDGKLTSLNNFDNLTSKIVFDCAKLGDSVSLKVVDKTAYYLAIGIASICDILNPESVVIGGGVSKAGEFFLEKVKKYYEELVFYSIRDTEICLASLYNDAGIYGAFASVKDIVL
ncbi:MAG: ROK family protein [Bacilli bacterium]|nr:ROK family protein [Bacilli bacterium]